MNRFQVRSFALGMLASAALLLPLSIYQGRALAQAHEAAEKLLTADRALNATCRQVGNRLEDLNSSDTLIVTTIPVDQSVGLQVPLFGALNLSIPGAAAGARLVLWHIPFHVEPDVAMAGPGGRVGNAFYYITKTGRVESGPFLPAAHEIPTSRPE